MILDSVQGYEYNLYETDEFSNIVELPLEVNKIIVEYLIGDAVETGVVEARELMEITESTHTNVCLVTRSKIPYDIKMYVSEYVDTRDPDDVDEEVYSSAASVRRVALNKLYLLFCLQMVIPTVDASVPVPMFDWLDPYADMLKVWLPYEDFKTLALIAGSCMFLILVSGLILVIIHFICLVVKIVCMKIKNRVQSMWVRFRMGTLEKDDEITIGVITKYVHSMTDTYYEARIEGKYYKLYPEWAVEMPVIKPPKSVEKCEREKTRTDSKTIEMAQKNSSLSTAEYKPVGAILSTDGNKCKVIGGFFRIDDYLVTAQHVIEVVHSKVERYVLASVTKSNSKCKLGNYMSLDKKAFDFTNNVIKFTEIDCFAIKMSKKFWSQMGLQTTKCAHSHYDQAVTAVGIRNGILVCATGLTSEHDQHWMLKHKATTYPGFSGFPVFRGNGIVGLHTGSLSDTNEMVRIETIMVMLPKNESPQVYFEDYWEGRRAPNGALKRMARYFDFDVSVDRAGRIYFEKEGVKGNSGLTTQDLYNDPEAYEDIAVSNVAKYIGYEADSSNDNEFVLPTKTLEQIMMEEDNYDSFSHSVSRPESGIKPSKPRSANKKKRRKESSEVVSILPSNGVVHLDRLEHMTVPKIREENLSMHELLQSKSVPLSILGYDGSKFQWPKLTALGERVSLEKHLQLYHKRCKTTDPHVKEPYVREILYDLLSEARYDAPVGYKVKENLERIIESSDVKDSKSPGYPYAAQGMANNAAVIAKHGVHGVADLVTQLWDKKLICRVFNKGEPHSIKKINAEMLRIIAGFPIHKTIKHTSIFKNLATAFHDSWRKNSVKYNYSPLVVGDNKHLRDWLGVSGEKWSSDKSNWDFNMFPRYYDYCADVIVDLACKPHGMTSEQFKEYECDVRNAINEVKDAEYVTSDGSHYRSDIGGIMRSGWFLTIICNSISQLAHHIEVCLKLGMSKKDIIGSKIIVGGDDVIMNALKNYSKEEYIQASKTVGVELEIEASPTFEGCEFFSHRFYSRGRGVAAIPTRFTKHIENLRRTTVGSEASSLASLMSEWVWDDDKFEFLYSLYSEMRQHDPDNFPLKFLPNKDILRVTLSGGESGAVNRN